MNRINVVIEKTNNKQILRERMSLLLENIAKCEREIRVGEQAKVELKGYEEQLNRLTKLYNEC